MIQGNKKSMQSGNNSMGVNSIKTVKKWFGVERRGTVNDGEGRKCYDFGLLITKAKNGNGTEMGRDKIIIFTLI